MKRRPTPTIEPTRRTELVALCGNDFKVDRLLSLWKCSGDRDTFCHRAAEAGYSVEAVTHFLRP